MKSIGAPERISGILQKLLNDGSVNTIELAVEYKVSEQQIRNDLRMLEKRGLCFAIRGGAVSVRKPTSDKKQESHSASEGNVRVATPGVRRVKSGQASSGNEEEQIFSEVFKYISENMKKELAGATGVWFSGHPAFAWMMSDNVHKLFPEKTTFYTDYVDAGTNILRKGDYRVGSPGGFTVLENGVPRKRGVMVEDWLRKEHVGSISMVFIQIDFIESVASYPVMGFNDDMNYRIAKILIEEKMPKKVILYSLQNLRHAPVTNMNLPINREHFLITPVFEDDIEKSDEFFLKLNMNGIHMVKVERREENVLSAADYKRNKEGQKTEKEGSEQQGAS